MRNWWIEPPFPLSQAHCRPWICFVSATVMIHLLSYLLSQKQNMSFLTNEAVQKGHLDFLSMETLKGRVCWWWHLSYACNKALQRWHLLWKFSTHEAPEGHIYWWGFLLPWKSKATIFFQHIHIALPEQIWWKCKLKQLPKAFFLLSADKWKYLKQSVIRLIQACVHMDQSLNSPRFILIKPQQLILKKHSIPKEGRG